MKDSRVETVNEKSIKEAGELINKARKEMGKRIVGQADASIE